MNGNTRYTNKDAVQIGLVLCASMVHQLFLLMSVPRDLVPLYEAASTPGFTTFIHFSFSSFYILHSALNDQLHQKNISALTLISFFKTSTTFSACKRAVSSTCIRAASSASFMASFSFAFKLRSPLRKLDCIWFRPFMVCWVNTCL